MSACADASVHMLCQGLMLRRKTFDLGASVLPLTCMYDVRVQTGGLGQSTLQCCAACCTLLHILLKLSQLVLVFTCEISPSIAPGGVGQAALEAATDPLQQHDPVYVTGHGFQPVASLLPRLELAKRLLSEAR